MAGFIRNYIKTTTKHAVAGDATSFILATVAYKKADVAFSFSHCPIQGCRIMVVD